MNSRLDTIQAAILLVKMDALEKYELADVNAAAAMYNEALAGIPAILPVVPEGWYSSWAQYTLRLRSREERDSVQSELKAQGIPTMVYYPKPMHTQQAFDGLKQYIPCPVTEGAVRHGAEPPDASVSHARDGADRRRRAAPRPEIKEKRKISAAFHRNAADDFI